MANVVTRAMHDLGLAAWFGGTLANAVSLNPAAGEATNSSDAGAVTNAGWNRWTPVNAAAIGMHLVGAGGQLIGNKGRVVGQSGVATMSVVKTALTGAALAATGISRMLGKRVAQDHRRPVQDGTTPAADTPAEVASAQRQLSWMQWAIPALTGALVVVSALAGEQQRPSTVVQKVADRLT